MLVTHPAHPPTAGSMAVRTIPGQACTGSFWGLFICLSHTQGGPASEGKGGKHPDAINWSQGICVVTSDLEVPHSKPSLQVWLENTGGGAGASLLPQILTGGTVSGPRAFSPTAHDLVVAGTYSQ